MLEVNRKSLENHVVSLEEEKEMLQWEGFAEKGFKSWMKERVMGDEKLIIIIINVAVRGINELNAHSVQHTGIDIQYIQ